MPSRRSKAVQSSSFRYLDETEILVIHAKIIDASSGSHGVRDVELVRGALDRPKTTAFGGEVFPTVFDKADCYFHSIAFNHPFVDGNKRTSFALAVRFLYLNGYEFSATNSEAEDYVVTAVVDHHEIPDIALWLQKWSKKM